MRDFYVDINELSKGLYKELDTTKAPKGSASLMQNMRITDRGGIAPRLGTELLGNQVVYRMHEATAEKVKKHFEGKS